MPMSKGPLVRTLAGMVKIAEQGFGASRGSCEKWGISVSRLHCIKFWLNVSCEDNVYQANIGK
jgi:hypothetical protein